MCYKIRASWPLLFAASARPIVLVLSGEDCLKDPAADPLFSPSSWDPPRPTFSLSSGDKTNSPTGSHFVVGARTMLSASFAEDGATCTTAAADRDLGDGRVSSRIVCTRVPYRRWYDASCIPGCLSICRTASALQLHGTTTPVITPPVSRHALPRLGLE
jgi:hypothetical protein